MEALGRLECNEDDVLPTAIAGIAKDGARAVIAGIKRIAICIGETGTGIVAIAEIGADIFLLIRAKIHVSRGSNRDIPQCAEPLVAVISKASYTGRRRIRSAVNSISNLQKQTGFLLSCVGRFNLKGRRRRYSGRKESRMTPSLLPWQV